MSTVTHEHRIEAIRERLQSVVVARQGLRETGSSQRSLERNRRHIVRLQHELSDALIARHTRALVHEAA